MIKDSLNNISPMTVSVPLAVRGRHVEDEVLLWYIGELLWYLRSGNHLFGSKFSITEAELEYYTGQILYEMRDFTFDHSLLITFEEALLEGLMNDIASVIFTMNKAIHNDHFLVGLISHKCSTDLLFDCLN
jgi:hypothetical protein